MFKSKKPNFKIILLRDDCAALEGAVNLKLQKTPDFFKNYGDYGNLLNEKISIHKSWNGLSFIAIKEGADINSFKAEDILVYCSVSIKRPHSSIVEQIGLMSFCDDINLVLEVVSKITDRLNQVYGINNIGFTAVEGETTYRLFNLVYTSEKLTKKYFKNWVGRYVGYKTNQSFSQKGELRNLHFFEILLKN